MKTTKIAITFFLFIFIASFNTIDAGIYLKPSLSGHNSINGENISRMNRNKDGRFKRKKGFMWGLFKKKSACDCPKH